MSTKRNVRTTTAFVSALLAAVVGTRLVPTSLSLETPNQPASTAVETSSRAETPVAAAQRQQGHPGSSQKHTPAAWTGEIGSIDQCKLGEDPLTYLQPNPTVEELLRFVPELSCEKLRTDISDLLHPGLKRWSTNTIDGPRWPDVAEAMHAEWHGQPKWPYAGPGEHSAPSANDVRPDDAQSCRHEEARLVRLRAHPNREEVIRFADELRCEDLRPQVDRLLEMF
jgi:hypothetical protein